MELPEDHIMKKTAVYRIAGMEKVRVRRDLEWERSEAGALTIDLYRPAETADEGLRPAVVSVAGYPDPGMERIFGLKFKECGWSTSWARLIAATGLVAVNYSNREPVEDVGRVLRYLANNGAALGVDADRIGLIASSGHGPLALSALMDAGRDAPFRCAVLVCPFTLDLDGFTAVADAARMFRFSNPTAGRLVDHLPEATPLFIARAGHDEMPGLNETLDRFTAKALARNLRLTLIHHASGPHAFDVMDDSETSREIIRGALSFLRFHLTA